MLKLPRTYGLYIVMYDGTRECVLKDETSPRLVRNVAAKIKQRPGRKVVITRDNKDLPGGAAGLDTELYEMWLKDHEGTDSTGTD